MKTYFVILIIFFCEITCCEAVCFSMDSIFKIQALDRESLLSAYVWPTAGDSLSWTAGWSPVYPGIPVNEMFLGCHYRRFSLSSRAQLHKLMQNISTSVSATVCRRKDVLVDIRLDHGMSCLQGYAADHAVSISLAWRMAVGKQADVCMSYRHFYSFSGSRQTAYFEPCIFLGGNWLMTEKVSCFCLLEKPESYDWRIMLGGRLTVMERFHFLLSYDASQRRIAAGIKFKLPFWQVGQTFLFHPDLGCGSFSCVSGAR